MLKKTQRGTAAILVLTALLLLLLNLFYFAECDELYFSAWEFASAGDRLLSRPIRSGSYVIGLMHNGRLLGNFLGVAQAKLLLSPLGRLRAVLFTALLLALILLLRRVGAKKSALGLPAALVLVLCAPRGIYANVYSWGVAFVNYLLPMLGLLLCLRLLRREKPAGAGLCVGLFVTAFLSQLFVETFTLSACVFGLLTLFERRRPLRLRLALCAGFLAGALCMFLNPEYRTVAEGGAIYSVGLSVEKALRAANAVCSALLLRALPLSVLLSAALTLCLRKTHGKKALLLLLPLLPALGLWTAARLGAGLPAAATTAAGALLALSWLIAVCRLPEREKRWELLVLLLTAAASVLPLALLNEALSARMYFEAYLLLGLVLLRLLPERVPREKALRAVLLGVCGLWLCALLFVYGRNSAVNRERIELGRAAVSQGAERVELPLVPYPDFMTNEQIDKGDLGFLIFRETPLDTPLRFLPYELWQETRSPD